MIIILNWINIFEVGEEVLVEGCVDMISMVCLFFVDVDFVKKVIEGKVDLIVLCIVCN